ncbi:MAG: 5-(carboxyamino)imidazole ribonucleotide synthase [Bacteroidota bacterium]
MQFSGNNNKIGLLGGGQLGRMLLQAAIDLDLHLKILDPDPSAPCALIAPEFVNGSFQDFDTVYNFGQDCELITIEIENVNIEALEKLEAEGKKVFPQPKVLRIIQDKRVQKQFYKDHGIPTAPFILTDNKEEIEKNVSFFPAFNKLGIGGYDGRGVQKLSSVEDIELAFNQPSLLEKAIDFQTEIAIIVARNEAGEIKTFPSVEMAFHPTQNLVEYLFSPANISAEINQQAEEIAISVAEKLGIVGILAVEMFVTKDGNVLVNEVAPRTHNSGHQTIRANFTSQFEQHIRAILNLPLGDTTAFMPAAMVNLLGEKNYEGNAKYLGLTEILKEKGVFPFLYGKKTTKPFRKMGHVTVLGENIEELEEKVNLVREKLKVVSF